MDEFSWFVGLFEGEGCFHLCKCQNRLSIRVSMTDEDTITRAAKFLGTKVKYQHPPSWKKKGWKPQWYVEYAGLKSIPMMEKMKPYLSKRRQEQMENVLETHAKNRRPVGRPKKTKG